MASRRKSAKNMLYKLILQILVLQVFRYVCSLLDEAPSFLTCPLRILLKFGNFVANRQNGPQEKIGYIGHNFVHTFSKPSEHHGTGLGSLLYFTKAQTTLMDLHRPPNCP